MRQHDPDVHLAESRAQCPCLSHRVGLGPGALQIPGIDLPQRQPRLEPQQGIAHPEHQADQAPGVVDHDPGLPARLQHPLHLGDGLGRIRAVVQHAPGIHPVERRVGKLQPLRIPDGQVGGQAKGSQPAAGMLH